MGKAFDLHVANLDSTPWHYMQSSKYLQIKNIVLPLFEFAKFPALNQAIWLNTATFDGLNTNQIRLFDSLSTWLGTEWIYV